MNKLIGVGLILVLLAIVGLGFGASPAEVLIGIGLAILITLLTTDATKECPKCAEPVKFAAKVCHFCGHNF